mmetsp:Transcript_44216/g.122394  ORF Transcript_44216/g.122394 Transcript_44216/m.122394 type:complete len:267 (-) Transcript_44216:1020-1820(-)
MALRLHELLERLLVITDVHEQKLPQGVVIRGPVLAIMDAMIQEAELRSSVIVYDVLHHVVLEQQPARNDQMWRPVRGVHDVDASGELVEERQGPLHHRLNAIPRLQVVPYLVDEQPEDRVLVFKTENGREAFANLLLQLHFRVLPDVYLPELLQKVQISELEALTSVRLLVCQVHQPEDPARQLAIHDVRGCAICVCTACLGGSVPTNEGAHHVHEPGHFLLENQLRHRTLLPQGEDLLEVFHDVLRRVLITASAEVRKYIELLRT